MERYIGFSIAKASHHARCHFAMYLIDFVYAFICNAFVFPGPVATALSSYVCCASLSGSSR